MRVALIGVGRIGALHAATLRDLPAVDSLLVADADAGLASSVAASLTADGGAIKGSATKGGATAGSATTGGVTKSGATKSGATEVAAVADVPAVFEAAPDAVVIAAATSAHAELVHLALDARLPVFCEKPVAPDVAGTRAVIDHVAASGVPLHVGFQRRFDAGYRVLRDAVGAGVLGRLHTLRGCTADAAPPHPSYVPRSGGIFRDCAVHDFDAIRWVSGREVVEVYATGANKGERFFADAGDVDTGCALLTLDDDTLASVSCTRYNGQGYDVRLEVCGSRGSMVAGLDDRAPLRPAGDLVPWPYESAYRSFADRFHDAYVAELAAFTEVAQGRRESPCSAEDALRALLIAEAAELSRVERRPVRLAELP